ncbi:uncharacterized protein LOC133182814 [Saccostrea echinata]|uniref:uncharacterized protein LOC133182814 n=1 Tax=Saccostrea echinata TaxID=191078 RepID=UPI002A7EF0C0|nr:uncharacterized protein LOC133182814 [Saccostrea echinata]
MVGPGAMEEMAFPVDRSHPLLGMNRSYSIHLTAIDEDDDVIFCRFAKYVEAGPAITKRNIPNTVVDENCTITIDTSDSRTFQENATGVIAVTVQDYPAKYLTLKGDGTIKQPYLHVLSAVSVQFFVFIVKHADEPIFVDPTPPNRQTFIIYVGVEFTVDYYARPTAPEPSRKIERFEVTRTGGRDTNQTGITYLARQRIAKITVSWVPTETDIGKDILCARVEDNMGFETVDLHCFSIVIKPYTSNPGKTFKDLPYFVHFPEPGDIIFPENSYCKFPVYAASSSTGGITNITIMSTEASSAVIIGAPRHANNSYGPGAMVIQVQLKEPLGGQRKICFEAADVKSKIVKCLVANVLKKDPCATKPCQHSGQCIASEDGENFNCRCINGFSGKTCETNPKVSCVGVCKNGGHCIQNGPRIFCLCMNTGYTGFYCDNKLDKCDPNPCGDHGICINSDTGFCNCTEGYSGPSCTRCSSSTCHNNGICLKKSGLQQCVCPVGFSGDKCQNTTTESLLNFVPPTAERGSVISCNIYLDPTSKHCEFPVYLQASALPSIESIVNNDELHVLPMRAENATIEGLPNVYMSRVKISRTDAPWTFIWPTPEKETTFKCQAGTYCHVIVYTQIKTPAVTKCEQVLVTSALGAKTFPTKPVDDKCLTDVVFTDNNFEGKHRVCLKSWKDGESRCYFINVVKNMTDTCDSNPCLNGGLCIQRTGAAYSCICTANYKGANCQKGPCSPSDKQCKNEAYCYTTGTEKFCYCKTGYSGANCTHESSENVTDPQHDGGKFTDSVYTTNVTCFVSKPCRIPHIITGDINIKPTLRPGYVSPDVTIEGINVAKHSNSTQTYHSTTIIKAENTGQKKVCIQIYNEKRLTSDEVCFNVTVTQGSEYQDKMFAHFISPTLPDETEMQCKIGRPCHLTLWTKNVFGNNSCPFVQPDKTPEDGVYIFQQTDKTSPCMNDVTIKLPNVGKTKLCFQALGADFYHPESENGETRCYNLEIVAALTVKSSCSNVKCMNGGFCDSNTLTGECRCVLGFSGRHCEMRTGASLISTTRNTMMTDMAIPENIICHLGEHCDIPFSVTTNSTTRPSTKLGHYDEGLTVSMSVLQNDQHTTLNTFIGHVTVTPDLIGSHIVCIQTSTDKILTTDERCVNVLTPNNETMTTVNKNLPHYESPTLPNNTQVICPPAKTCHLILNISPGLHENCPDIKRMMGNADFTHIFHSNTNNKVIGNCTADVAITPLTNHNSSDLYCFEVSFPSVPGEKRCFNVTYKVPAPSTCVGQKCEKGGFCDSTKNITTCKCPITSSGIDCGSPGSQRPGISTSLFGTFAVPTFLTCERLVTCDLPVTLNGNLNARDIHFGFVSNELSMRILTILEPLQLKPGVRILNIDLLGKEKGMFTACLQSTRRSKVMEHCVTIQVVEKGSNGTIGSIDKSRPHFENTLPSNTELHCNPTKECHLLLKHKAKSGKCINVFGKEIPGITHIMNAVSPDPNGTCQTDVLVYSKTNRTETLCLSISDESTVGETRCFKFAINKKTIESSCTNVTCLNSGYCIGDLRGNFTCVCPGGHTGRFCSLDGGIIPTNHTQYSPPGPDITPKFVDTAIPEVLPCKINTECGINLLVKADPYARPDLQTDSPIIKVPIETVEVPSSNGTYITGIKFQSNKTGIQTVCVNTVLKRNKADEICFKVNVTDSTYIPPTIENGKTPHFNMTEPTIPDGSSVNCEEDSTCHLILRLDNDNNGNCLHAKVTPIIPNARMVKAYLTSNTCVADAVIVTHKGDKNKTVCFEIDGMAASHEREKRCVIVNTVEHIQGSPCNELSCNRNGYCETDISTQYTCLCKLGFEGKDCENKVKPLPIPRKTNDSTIPIPVFVDSVLPKQIHCNLMEDCLITIPVLGSQMNQSSLSFGHFENGVIPGLITMENITDPINQTLAHFHIKATEQGTKFVCVHSRNLNTNTDEICLKVLVTQVTALMTTTSTPTKTPKIVEPSLSSGTVVQCEFGGSCHFHLVTQPAPSSSYCPDIKNMASSSITKVHSFTSDRPSSSSNTCHVDVSFKPEVPGNHTLCVQAQDNSKGDQRCFVVNVVTNINKTYGGPCQIHHCYNKGRCEADPLTSDATCICPIGFSDINCQTSKFHHPSTITKHTFTDTAVPNVITCPINTDCGIPLIITGPPGNIPHVNSNSPLVDKPVQTHTYPGPSNTTYETNIMVHGTKEGIHDICAHVGANGNEICFKVNITSSKNTSSGKEKNIQEPTIPDLSSVKCLENTVCHLLVHSSKYSNGSCILPKLSPATSATNVLKTDLTTFNQSLCVTDVATLVKPGETKTICVETTSKSDKRCITVNAVKNLTNSSPCSPNPCQGSGFCLTSDYVNHTCVCKTGLGGRNCEKKLKPKPIPRQNTNSTNTSLIFVDTMLPKEIVCYTAQDCPIILPVDGQPLYESSFLFGHLDKGISPRGIDIDNITSPLNQTIAQFHLIPSESGTKHVCVQTRNLNINTDEVCIKVVILANHTTTTPLTMKPKIISPSMPNGTVLQCEYGKESCHIPLYTAPTNGSSKCPEIENMASSSTPNVHAFSSDNNLVSACHVDLSVKPEVPGNHTLCVRAKDKNNGGDVRCYTIQVVTSNNKTLGGPCQQKQCHNGGRCEADPVALLAQCICPVEILDPNCLTNTSIVPKVPGTSMPTIPTHTFTDTAIPDVIQCSMNTECGIPLIITGPPGNIPEVKTNSPLVHNPIPTINYPGHSNTTYQTNIKVLGTKEELKKICVHIGEKGDEICFKVNITSKNTLSANTTKNIQEPTIPDESSVKCLENTVCHLLIHSAKFSNDSCIIPMQSPVTTGTVVLKTAVTTFNQSLCVTDVATLVKPGENKKICVETFSSDRRCIMVNAVKNISNSSPCTPNPCEGKGFCITFDYVNHTCVCKTGLEGQNCERKVKPLPIPRQNTTLTNTVPIFVDTMLPKEIVCYLVQDCPIILPVDGQPLNRSSLLFGHIDKGITPQNIELEHTSPLNQTIAQFHVLPSESGTKHVCVQTGNLNTNTDEVCIKIVILPNVTTTSPPSTMSPKIASPSMPNGTVLQCEYGEKSCHVPLYTTPIPGSNKCPDVENTASSSISNTFAFSSENSQGSLLCHVDLSVKPEIPGNHTLCVRVKNKTADGDIRCYTVQVVTSNNKTFGGPCQQKHCHNGGRCEADPVSLTSQCICPVGYSDTNCLSQIISISPTLPGVTVPTTTKPIFTDTAIPDIIQCSAGSTCSVPLIIKGESGNIPQVDTDSTLVTHPIRTVMYPGKTNDTFQTNIKMSSLKEGVHTVCTHIVDNREKGDEICFRVNFTSPVTTVSTGNHLNFQEPTIPDTSSVNCLENNTCHVLLHTPKDNNGNCLIPRQAPFSSGTAILKTSLTTFDQNLCVTDIATIAKHRETKKLCVEVNGSTDKRCIIVNAVTNLTKSLCNSKPCGANGYCKSTSTSSYVCICKVGFKGVHCENTTKPIPVPRPSNKSSNSTPIFVNTMLPKEITCQLNKDCTIMIPVHGSPVNKSSLLFGHLDKGVEPEQINLVDLTKPVNQSIAQFHVTPSETGTRRVCVQTRNSKTNTDEICVNVNIIPVQYFKQMTPEIVSPSLPNGTVLQCESALDSCHIQLVTKPTPGSKSCPRIENTPTSSLVNVHDFTSETVTASDSVCHTDLSVKPNAPGNHSLCIRARQEEKAGGERCYVIQVVTNGDKTFGGPCQDRHCYNDGRCEANSISKSTCICPVGFAGSNCQKSQFSPLINQGNTGKPNNTAPIFTNTAIPDVIQCSISTPCGVPLIVTGPPGDIPTVDTDSPFVIHPVRTDTFPGNSNTTYQTNIKLKASKKGQRKICINTVHKSSKGDEICFKVNFTSGTPTKPPTAGIQEPTIPDSSTVKCLENTDCHLLIHTSKDNSGNCEHPKELPHTSGTVIINTEVTSFDPNFCVTDVVTKVQHGETKKICIGTHSSSEKRCIIVNPSLNSTTSHCHHISCNKGYCFSNDHSFTCICPVGKSGRNCQNHVPHIPIPRDPSANITKNSTIFVDTGVPTDINCVLNRPCEFLMPISGQNLSIKSLAIGSKNASLKLCPLTLSGTDTKIAHFCVKPTQVGTEVMCVQTRNTVGVTMDEVCLKIHTTSAPQTTATPHTVKDNVINPSYPDGSVIKCMVNKTCFVPVITEKSWNPPCPKIKQTERTTLEILHVFTPRSPNNGACFGNITIIPQQKEIGKQDLCFKAVQQNYPGTEHCLVIEVVDSVDKSKGGPCQTKHCEHFSQCISDVVTNTAICNCSTGYTGDLCEKIDATTVSSPVSAIMTSPSVSLLGHSSSQTCKISVKDALKAARNGRVKCTCHSKGKTSQVITTNPTATLDQLVKAAGIGAGSVGGSIAIATFIYVIVQKLRNHLKVKEMKRRPKYIK